MLHLKESGALTFDPGHTEASLLGDVDLCEGKHCWGYHIRTRGYSEICIGVLKHLGEVIIACELHSTLPQNKGFIYIYIYIYIFELHKYIYTSNYYILHGKNTKYKYDTAGSMLCHNNPAAYTYKESFTLYSIGETGY